MEDTYNVLQILALHESAIAFNPKTMVCELLAYGEQEAADALLGLNENELLKISVRAYEIYSKPSQERGVILDNAICLAIVEYIEGKSRPLRRKRRLYSK
jgi:hypothetical protein